MMVKIQVAKEEALKHSSSSSSREKLIDDIKYLYNLLSKAKGERGALMKQQESLKGTIRQQKEAYALLAEKKKQDKAIFVEMLKRERVTFEQKLIASDRKVLWFEQEMRRVAGWARQRQSEYAVSAAELHKEVRGAKQETQDQASSLNLDLASELESLRYEAAELLRGEGN